MVAPLQGTASDSVALARLLEPDILIDGQKPEQRAVYSGISWKRYMEIDKQRGDDVSVPKFYYLDGDLEIMSSSDEHERLKAYIGDLMADFFFESGLEVVPRASATMWLEFKEAGAAPDNSWCLGEPKKFPDIVVEIALTSGGVDKLKLYARFAVPEVWIWRQKRIEIYVLQPSGEYVKREKSELLPTLDVALIERCAMIPSWYEARRTFREALVSHRRSHER